MCAWGEEKKEAQVINGFTNRKQRKEKNQKARKQKRREEQSMSDSNMQEIRNKRTLMGNNKRVWRMKKNNNNREIK